MKTKTRSLLTYILFCNTRNVIKGYRYDSIRNGNNINSNCKDKKRKGNDKIRNGKDETELAMTKSETVNTPIGVYMLGFFAPVFSLMYC